MTDPFSMTVGIVALVKEGYLVANFIYQKVNSARHHIVERYEIARLMRKELLMLRAFGRYFVLAKGMMTNDPVLDNDFLLQVTSTLEELGVAFSEYAKIAGSEDAAYQEHLSTRSHQNAQNTLLGRNIERELPAIEPLSPPPEDTSFNGDSITKFQELKIASKWALWDKRRLESVVSKFHSSNASLQEILVVAQSFQLQSALRGATGRDLTNGDDAKMFGLTGHAEIRRLVEEPENNEQDYMLTHAILHEERSHTGFHLGTCDIHLAQGNYDVSNVLIEYKNYPRILEGLDDNEEAHLRSRIRSRVHQLASLLDTSGSNGLGTLGFKGLIDQPSESRHAFVFDLPRDVGVHSIRSLSEIIANPTNIQSWPLSARFKVAHDVARSIGAFHADGWVHKNIHSGSIIFFQHRETEKLMMDAPHLVGFEYSRPESGSTLRLRPDDDESSSYRHPDILEAAPPTFSKVYDIYSLGVVLLEIALWQTVDSMLKNIPTKLSPTGLQKFFVDRAKRKVAHFMGTSYQAAVLICLQSKYKDQTRRRDFPKIFHEEIVQGVAADMIL